MAKKEFDIARYFSTDKLLSKLGEIQKAAQKADNNLSNIGKDSSLIGLTGLLGKLEDSLKHMAKSSSSTMSSIGISLKGIVGSKFDVPAEKLDNFLIKLQSMFDELGKIDINSNTKETKEKLNSIVSIYNEAMSEIGATSNFKLNNKFGVAKMVGQLGQELKNIGNIDINISDSISGATTKAVAMIDQCKQELVNAYKEYYKAGIEAYEEGLDIDDGKLSSKMLDIQNKISGILRKYNINNSTDFSKLFDEISFGNVDTDDISDEINTIFSNNKIVLKQETEDMVSTLQIFKKQLVKAYTDYYNAKEDALKTGHVKTDDLFTGDAIFKSSKMKSAKEDIDDLIGKYGASGYAFDLLADVQYIDEGDWTPENIEAEVEKMFNQYGDKIKVKMPIDIVPEEIIDDVALNSQQISSIQKESVIRVENAKSIDKENQELKEQIDLKKKAQMMTFNDFFEDESLHGAFKQNDLSTIFDIEKYWKQANYEKDVSFHRISEDEIEKIKGKYLSEGLLNSWYGANADFSKKSVIENIILGNDELRNAALNNLYNKYLIVEKGTFEDFLAENAIDFNSLDSSGKKETKDLYNKYISENHMAFEDFINSEHTVYRGKETHAFLDKNDLMSYSFNRETANVFGNNVKTAKIVPKNTIGNFSTYDYGLNTESEIFIPAHMLSYGRQSDKSFEEVYKSLRQEEKKAINAYLVNNEFEKTKQLLNDNLRNSFSQLLDDDSFSFINDYLKAGDMPDKMELPAGISGTEEFKNFAELYNKASSVQKKLLGYYASLKQQNEILQGFSNFDFETIVGSEDLPKLLSSNPNEISKHINALTGQSKFNLLNKISLGSFDSKQKANNVLEKIEDLQYAYTTPDQAIEQIDELYYDILDVSKTSQIDEDLIKSGKYIQSSDTQKDEIVGKQKLYDKIKQLESKYNLELDFVRDYLNQVFDNYSQEVDEAINDVDKLQLDKKVDDGKSAQIDTTTELNKLADKLEKEEYDDVAQSSVDKNIDVETQNYENLRAKIAEVEQAIDNKSAAFSDEKATVESVVASEIEELDKLEKKLDSVITKIKIIEDADLDIKQQGSDDQQKLIEMTSYADNQANIDKIISDRLPKDAIDNKILDINSDATKGIVSISGAYKDAAGEIQTYTLKLDQNNKVLKENFNANSKLVEKYKQKINVTEDATEITEKENKKTSEQKKLEANIEKINKKISSATDKYNVLSGIDQSSFSKSSVELFEQYKQKYNELLKLKRSFDTDPASVNMDEFNAAAADVDKLAGSFDKLIQKSQELNKNAVGSIEINDDDIANVDKLRQKMELFAKDGINGSIQNINFKPLKDGLYELTYQVDNGKNGVQSFKISMDQLNGTLVKNNGAVKSATGGWANFTKVMSEGWNNVLRYMSSFMGFYEMIAMVRQGINYVKEIDAALTELKKVTDETDAAYERFLNTASQTASRIGSTISNLTTMTADWARIGYSMSEAADLAESTAILLNVSEFSDSNQASEALISTIQAYGYAADESMQVVDVLNEVGKILPVDNYNG